MQWIAPLSQRQTPKFKLHKPVFFLEMKQSLLNTGHTKVGHSDPYLCELSAVDETNSMVIAPKAVYKNSLRHL
jgi:hypothetical protein